MITDHDVTEAMIKYGGSFVQQLGQLLRAADADNKRRLVTAFPEYLEKYKEIARQKIAGLIQDCSIHHHHEDASDCIGKPHYCRTHNTIFSAPDPCPLGRGAQMKKVVM